MGRAGEAAMGALAEAAMETAERILFELCQKLMKHLSGDDSIIIDEMEVPAVDAAPESKTYMTSAAIKYPTFGETRLESLGWMAAQALYSLPEAHPLAIETHAALVLHGIKIPTREEYQKATVELKWFDSCSATGTRH